MATRPAVWLNGGRHRGRRVIPARYVTAATSAHVVTNGAPPEADAPGRFLFSYGYGWMVSAYDGFYEVSHGGNVSGFSSSAVFFPTAGVGVVALANQTNSLLPSIVTDLMATRMLRTRRRAPGAYPVVVGPVNALVPVPGRTALNAAAPQHLCLDKAYDNPTGHAAVAAPAYVPHLRRIGEEKLDAAGEKRSPARRWVVERTLAWLSTCRAILIRYDTQACNYLGLIKLACALLWYRRQHQLAVLR